MSGAVIALALVAPLIAVPALYAVIRAGMDRGAPRERAGRRGLTVHWRLFRYVRPHWRPLLVSLAGMVAGVLLSLAGPWPMKLFIDNVAGHHRVPGWLQGVAHVVPGLSDRESLLVVVAIASLLIFVLGVGNSMVEQIAGVRLNQRMTYDVASDLFSHLQRLSPAFHSRRSTGDTIARVTGDPACVQVFVTGAFMPLLQNGLTMVAMFVIMLTLQPLLTLLALLVSPFMLLTIRFFAASMKDRNRVARDLEGGIMALVEQTLTSIPVVQAFTREERNRQVFRREAAELVTAYESATRLGIAFEFFVGLTTAVGTAAILFLGGLYVIHGRMSVGTIVVFLSYLNGLFGPLNAMTHLSETVQYAAAQGDRVMEILDVTPDVQEAPDARGFPIRGHVRYSNVSFGYDPGRPVLQDISLEAYPGDVTAIVGPTGAGKTTLVNLLPRFFDPWTGSVEIDGVDVRQMALKSLRGQIALVLQDPFLFPMSVADNIAYGRPDASRDEIVEAARDANAHDFIERLPDGYDSIIGERGATLSGGEKQRVSIARAFLKDAPILVLDEPTSALDARTEALLLDALERLMAGRLTFIVAHRLSTIRHADQILVVDDGRIVERGAHDDLVTRDGMYAALYNRQMRFARHEPAVNR